jgi:hypothetical protein
MTAQSGKHFPVEIDSFHDRGNILDTVSGEPTHCAKLA